MNTYVKYCPNVFVAKCEEAHEKGEIINVTTKYGRENEHVVHNFLGEKNGFFYYSITRADGVDCQERARRKSEQLQHIADKKSRESSDYIQKAEDSVSGIVFGQPILVGHHSEKHHRRALERSHKAMDKSVELSAQADEYAHRAEYWKKLADKVNLSMPESIDFYAFEVERLEKVHQHLKEHPEARAHSYSLTYAKKDVNNAQKNYELAVKLWG